MFSWTEASMKAVNENKIVFVAAGNGSDDAILKKLLADERVRLFFERNLVPLSINMNTDAGERFKPKLLLYPSPVYAFFMPFGDLLLVVKPSDADMQSELFLEKGREALEIADVKRQNSRSIIFAETLPENVAREGGDNKPIFIFAYKQDVQSVLLMENNVFNLDRVADFYNGRFVCLKTDTVSYREYPVYRFVNKDGKLIYQTSGYLSPDDFLKLADTVLRFDKGVEFTDYNGIHFPCKKPLFIDVRNLNKGETELPDNAIYKDPELAQYFNNHFINTHLNWSSSDADFIKKQIEAETMPLYVFTDIHGTVVHRIARQINEDELLSEAQRFLSGKGLEMLRKEYVGGNRNDIDFIEDYLAVLKNAGLASEADTVAEKFLDLQTDDSLKIKRFWLIFNDYIYNVNSLQFAYVVKNQKDFEALYGKSIVAEKLHTVWERGGMLYAFDNKALNEYQKRLRKAGVVDYRNIILDAKMYAAEKTGDWKTYSEIAEQKWNAGGVSEEELYSWGLKISENSSNPSVRYRAARWFAIELDSIEQKEKSTGKVSHTVYKGYYRRLIELLLKN